MDRPKAESKVVVEDVEQVEALSRGLSRQAVRLYESLAGRMVELGNTGAGHAFERIEAFQRAQAGAVDGAATEAPPEIFGAGGLADSRLVTPYQAYSLAVRNEERAFAFWSQVSAEATEPAVQEGAERHAYAAMDRLRALRAERRHAYHEGSEEPSAAERLRRAPLPEVRREAAQREAALAALHERISRALAADTPEAGMLADIAREEAESARRLGAEPRTPKLLEPLATDRKALLDLATRELELAVEFYLVAAEHSRHEDVMAAAQDLADHGIRRLARLRRD